MIRVLHMIGNLTVGGSQTMIMALYRAIDRAQIQFDFVVDGQRVGEYEKEVERLGGRIYRILKFNGINGHNVKKAWNDFFQEHSEYSILHSHIRSYASLYLPIARKHGVKTIIHSHNTSNGKGMMAVAKWLLQYPLRYQADYFFGCSEKAGEWLFGRHVVKSDRYYMLKNAVDLKRFTFSVESRRRIRLELGVGENTLLLGHVGRMHPQKNHHFLLDIFEQLRIQNPNVQLIMLGDGEQHDEIQQHIQRVGLSKQVKMLGVKENVQDYLCAMDAFLLPSLYEGLPVVIVEAQASGLPCFVSDNVTSQVVLSDLVKYIPINHGVKPWVEMLLNSDFRRKDVSDDIQRAGFCVEKSSEWLHDFYLRITSEALGKKER